MTFSYSFKPQTKSVQKIDFDMIQEIIAEKLVPVEYAKELDVQQIAERAMDDLTGASYVSDEDGMTVDEAIDMMSAIIEESVEDFMKEPVIDQKALDAFTGNSENGNGPKGGDDNPNPFDDTTGDPPGVPVNPKGGGNQQESAGVNIFGSNGLKDPTTPEGGCEGDYDFWRPNPEERNFYSSMPSIDLNEFAGSNEMDLLINAMSVDTMGM